MCVSRNVRAQAYLVIVPYSRRRQNKQYSCVGKHKIGITAPSASWLSPLSLLMETSVSKQCDSCLFWSFDSVAPPPIRACLPTSTLAPSVGHNGLFTRAPLKFFSWKRKRSLIWKIFRDVRGKEESIMRTQTNSLTFSSLSNLSESSLDTRLERFVVLFHTSLRE